FQKLAPHESLFLETGIKLETFTIVHNALLRLKLVDFPGNLLLDDSLSLHPLDASVFSGPCAVVLVIDAQQEEAYTTSVARARRVIEFACKRNPDVTFDVLLHKVDGAKFYTDGRKEECKKAVEDKLTEDMSDKEKASICFHCTSIYDHTVFEAFSQVVQKLIPERPTLEKCLEAVSQNTRMEKVYLFDVVSKLYLAADKSNSELSWYELCADMVDVVIDIACRFTEAKAALASAWKQHGPSIGEAVLHQEVEDLRWRMGLPPLSDCSMGPSDWLLGAPDAQACLGRDCHSSIDFFKFDMRTIFVFIVSVAAASALGAFGLTYTWTRAEDPSDELPDWPQGPARSDGVWTLQPQWQEPLEADNPQTYHEDADAEMQGANEATAAVGDPDRVFESGLDSFLGEEFEPLALAHEHVSTPEPSPPQNAAVVGLTLAPMHLPLPAASTPPLHPQPSVPTGALQIPLNRLLPPLPLPDTSAARARAHSEDLDLDGMVRSFPATPEWSNVWFAGPEGPRRALTESQLIPSMASGFPGSGATVAGWPRQISHIHEPVEELHERPERESELHLGVMNSVQQLLEDEAPEWAGPADPVVQSSQWGFSCPGRWADAAEDVYDPETAWFEPQRSSSVGHAAEPKQRSRRRSKRRKQTAPEHTGPLGGESTESAIRVLQLEQLLMLDERIPSFQEPAPVGKQPRRATSQPRLSAKAKSQSRSIPQKLDPKAKARAPLQAQPQRRRSKQSQQSQGPEAQRREAQHQPGNPKASKAGGWRPGRESEWSRHVTHVRSPEGHNPEAVPQDLAVLAPEHVGQERPRARPNSEARGSRPHPIRNQVSDSRRRPRSRPKMPTSSALPQRSGRAWRAGRRSSESDPAAGLEDNKDAGCEFQLHNGAVLVLKEVGHCLALVCVFQGDDACFDRQELLEHNVEVFKEALNKICPVHLPKPRPQLSALTFGSRGVGAKPAAAPRAVWCEPQGHDNWEASVRVRCAFTALQAVTSLCRFPELEVTMSESIEGLLRPACLLVQSLHPAYEQAVIQADDGGQSEEEGGVAPFVAQTMELIQAMAVRVKLKPLLKNKLKHLLQLLVPFMRITENQAASWRADPNEFLVQEEDEHCRGCTIRVSGEGLVGQMLDSFKREASRAVAALATDLLERGEAGRSSGDAAAWKLTEVGLFVFSIAVGEATVKSLQRSELGPLAALTRFLKTGGSWAMLALLGQLGSVVRTSGLANWADPIGSVTKHSDWTASLGQPIVAKADQALGSKAAAVSAWRISERLQITIDIPHGRIPGIRAEGRLSTEKRAAGRILNSNALETLQTWFQPAADGLDSETSDGVDDALAGLLKDEVPYVVEFLSDKQFPGPICRAFWQSELYLRDFQQVAGQAPLEEFTQTAKHVTDKIQEDIQDGSETQALDRLVTRQQFGAAARFGYFLRRAKQRLRLESIMTGPVGTLETYVAEMSAQQQVELVRAASREASSAIDVRATALFGKASELLRAVAVGEVSPLPLSPEGRARLAVEAVAFGASLFDAED
ncbi:RRAGC, partial [Symbiodinium sp. CCMP2456]